MASMATAASPAADCHGHRRNKSSSVLKSIIVSKNHKRSPSDNTPLNTSQPENRPYGSANIPGGAPLLPLDHPHNSQRTMSRMQNPPSNPPSPRKSHDSKASPVKSLHQKTL